MWPFERQRDVLRIGKLAVELWGRESGGLVKRRGATIDGSVDLRGAVQSALQGASPMRAPVDVVVESAWIPVVLLEPGPNGQFVYTGATPSNIQAVNVVGSRRAQQQQPYRGGGRGAPRWGNVNQPTRQDRYDEPDRPFQGFPPAY